MKLKFLKTALLALTGASLAAISAKAQVPFTIDSNYNSGSGPAGDLILGVESTGTGSAYNYVVDLGQYTQFTPTSTINFGTNGKVSAADLSKFGLTDAASYSNTNANSVTFGVIGFANADNAAVSGIDATKDETVFATQVSNPGTPTENTLATASTDAANLAGDSYTSTANTNVGAIVMASASNSFASANADPTFFGLSKGGFVSFGSGLSLNLYGLNPPNDNGSGNATGVTQLLGNFTFTDGDLVFNGANVTSAVPEPSTYALGLCGLVALLALKRRYSLKS